MGGCIVLPEELAHCNFLNLLCLNNKFGQFILVVLTAHNIPTSMSSRSTWSEHIGQAGLAIRNDYVAVEVKPSRSNFFIIFHCCYLYSLFFHFCTLYKYLSKLVRETILLITLEHAVHTFFAINLSRQK
jgi:hypothetical protein